MKPLCLLGFALSALAIQLGSENSIQSISLSQAEKVQFDNEAALASASPITRELLGLSIEFNFIVDYLGDVGKPNPLSHRLLQNIEDRTGASPHIRVGGATQDVARYCEICSETMSSTFADDDIHAVNVSFNAGLFQVLNENAPSSQKYTFGLNLGDENIKVPMAELAAAQSYLNLSRLTHYELGNEPDYYYTKLGNRGKSWDVVAYVKQSLSYLRKLVASVAQTSRPEALPRFLYGSMANHPASQDFSLSTLAKLGVKDIVPEIAAFSEHKYFGEACTDEGKAEITIPFYLNHLNTLAGVAQYLPSIEASRSVGAQFIMGETNSAACHGLSGVSDTLAAALWMIDYALTSATLGIEQLYFHNGVGYPYSAWQPVHQNGTKAHVQALYYGFLFYADLIGDFKDGARTASIPSLNGVGLAHYAIYEPGQTVPKKLVILNLDEVNQNTTRKQKAFDVSSALGQDVRVARLTGPSSNATSGIHWAGQTVDGLGNLIGKRMVESIFNSTVSVGSSEAVIIERA
ncbi:hypothetical protein P170DRAFT_357055 [Aspergillus steynii IBT 23096]|uniref:Beta-glucuronidase C-terminal domain-containing protein n=1 Tax=Aspergillus steynii IBT 23096 TaxID=1392250 RepID=A0A2I2GA22_9EURO|nr:uncharacterized protein P170DRAFT_357055 [Aspergillus steynii IBT 23096]PLB49722.1 hypothetical protein P170DRAFT_357055 [Aspergillus steynii IBT 23096]